MQLSYLCRILLLKDHLLNVLGTMILTLTFQVLPVRTR